MVKLIHFFEHIQSWQRSLIIAGGLLLFWILEGVIPLFRHRYPKWQHAGLNLLFTLTTILVNLAFAFLIVRAANFDSRHAIGLLYLFPLHLCLFPLSALPLLDLISAWFIHWL